MSERLACLVPHCRRTIRADTPVVEWPDTGWICAEHYRGVPRIEKAVRARARRSLRRSPTCLHAIGRYIRLSKRVTRKAIEAAGGIG